MTDPILEGSETDQPPVLSVALTKAQLDGRIERVRRYLAGDKAPNGLAPQAQWENWGDWGNFANFIEFPD